MISLFYAILIAIGIFISISMLLQRLAARRGDETKSMGEFKKNISLIFTGGTIGGVVDSKTNSIKKARMIEEAFLKKIPHKSKIDKIAVLNFKPATALLSEQITPKEWQSIAGTIANEINEEPEVEGVVVTHGTDTMAFTVSAVTFMLSEIPVPIIFTGSNLPFSAPDSDAPENMSDSILVAAHKRFAGVYVVFPSKDGKTRDIHLGVRIQPINPYRSYFESIDLKPIGRVKNGKISLYQSPPFSRSYTFIRRKITVRAHIDSNIAHYCLFPGFNADYFLGQLVSSPNNPFRAVLLELYHSGTGCTREHEKYELTRFISALNDKNILVFGLPGPPQQQIYATSLALQEAGMIFLKKMSIPAAITKLMWLLGQYQNNSEVKDKMLEDLRGEISENSN